MVNNDKVMNKGLKKSKTFQNINSSERLAKTVKIINENFTCLICQQSFGHLGILNRHIKIVHGNVKNFTCLICINQLDKK